MNRLQTEQRRLYLDLTGEASTLMDSQGEVRAMVVQVAKQAGWDAVAALCHGLQNDLELPTPAIAVSGGEGFQVWISLGESVPVAHAQRFMKSLCQRFLSEVPDRHLQCLAGVEPAGQAALVPALQGNSGQWSAYVAPGLASMFVEEPWLDVPPGEDAQAQLLCRLESISPADLTRAKNELGLVEAPAALVVTPKSALAHDERLATSPMPVGTETEARRFLTAVMNDPAIEMALRIKAAKALLN